ncbi:MAG: hypothetical protein FJ146_15560 [Deltaproteobacteria bacterium]|nr:hypothetical protein [Deltaproteobacteria bacterium]
MYLPSLLLGFALIGASTGFAGVISSDPSINCSAAGGDGKECSGIRPSVLEGRFGGNVGLDASFAIRSQKNYNLSYDGSTQSMGRDFRLEDGIGLKLGVDWRFHFFDWLGLVGTVGIDMNSISSPDSSDETSGSSYSGSGRAMGYNESVNLGYTGGYLGASIYVPVQKITQAGFFVSARRTLVKKAELSMKFSRYGDAIKREATVVHAPQEIAMGFFLSVFYVNYVKRFESWRIVPQGGESYSPYTGHADGIELGLSGPIWSIWP